MTSQEKNKRLEKVIDHLNNALNEMDKIEDDRTEFDQQITSEYYKIHTIQTKLNNLEPK